MDDRLRTELLAVLEEFFERQDPARAPLARPLLPDRELQMAAAALMVCVVRADQASRQDEHRVLEKAIGRGLDLPEDEAAIVVRCAEEALDRGVRFPVGPSVMVGGEFRYQNATADLDTGVGFAADEIDLGGYNWLFSVAVRF